MKCEEVRDEMIAYLKGELDETRKNEVDEHLARCQGCRRELETSQKVLHQTQSANEAGVISMTQDIIEKAITDGASDIHLDPTAEGADILYRIDGVLRLMRSLSIPERDAVVARLRQMASLPQMETHMLQDARLETVLDDNTFDVRIAIMPVLYGEKIVMRILDRSTPTLGLDKMGFSDEQMAVVKHLVHQPNGLILPTGPTGSGKTTLLYSMVMEINKPDISIVTIEDPIEYRLRGVQQSQVNVKSGFTFATALRGYLRQDPDVLMVGEIRDLETAEVAVAAAVTGHLVFAPLHTDDAPGALARLLDMGVEPYLVGRTILGVIACRLARKICADCKSEYQPSAEALEFMGWQNKAADMKFFHGKGCQKCQGTGYRGRRQLHEVLVINKDLGKLVCRGEKDPDVLLAEAVKSGFEPMIHDGRRAILEGVTTPEEVYRVLWR